MKQVLFAGFFSLCAMAVFSCSENKAAENTQLKTALQKIEEAKMAKPTGAVKPDGPSIGNVQTERFVLKLHRAFAYEPKRSEVLAGMKPKPGFKFVYLDVSLKNTGEQALDGGFLMLALNVTGDGGAEYKKPVTALAAYNTDHPEDSNDEEYKALWGTFRPGEFHREIVWAVEVPVNENRFILHVPEAPHSKTKKPLAFTVH